MKVAIVTDSTAYLSEQQAKDYHIHVVPIPVIINGEIYDEGVSITTNEFYHMLETVDSLPTTSQPSLGDMITLYQQLAKDGYDAVISIHLSAGISGFVTNLKAAADTIEGIKVVPYDSTITCAPMGYLVMAAAQMAKEGADLKDILAEMDSIRDTIGAYMIVDDLHHLVRGGRLSNGSAIIGSLLKIKPILTFKDGEIVVAEKIRTPKKAFKRIEEILDEALKKAEYKLRVAVIHANNEAAAIEWQQKLQKKYPDVTFDISYFGPVIGTHLGEKSMALGWAKDIRK